MKIFYLILSKIREESVVLAITTLFLGLDMHLSKKLDDLAY
jgi:hypothetical protein